MAAAPSFKDVIAQTRRADGGLLVLLSFMSSCRVRQMSIHVAIRSGLEIVNKGEIAKGTSSSQQSDFIGGDKFTLF